MPNQYSTGDSYKSSIDRYLGFYLSRRKALGVAASAASVAVVRGLLGAAEPFLRGFEFKPQIEDFSEETPKAEFPTVLELPFFDSLSSNTGRVALAAKVVKQDPERFFTHRPLQLLIVRAAYPPHGGEVPKEVLEVSELLKKQSWPQVRGSDRTSLVIVGSKTDTDPWKPYKKLFELYRGMKKREPGMVNEKFQANTSFYLAQGLSPGAAAVKWIGGSLPDLLTGRDHNIPLQELQVVESYAWAYDEFPEVRAAFGDGLMELVKEVRAGLFSPKSERAKCVSEELRRAARYKARGDEDLADELESQVRINFINQGLNPVLFESDEFWKQACSYLWQCVNYAHISQIRKEQRRKSELAALAAEKPEVSFEQSDSDDELRELVKSILIRVKRKEIVLAIIANCLDGCPVGEALAKQGLVGLNDEQRFYYWKRKFFKHLKNALRS